MSGVESANAGVEHGSDPGHTKTALSLAPLPLTPKTELRLAPEVRTRFDDGGHVLIDAPNGTVVDIGPRGFATLALFVRPLPLGRAIERLEAECPGTDFAPTMSVIDMLIDEGALITGDSAAATPRGWANPVEHARMLDDHRRTNDYLTAIAEAVRPDDVVLDIGTGSGVLAVAAARAGARRVFAVEASDIAGVAERVFEVNGVADRVTLVPGWSRHVALEERADLLVAEIIGSEPLEEEILETTLDARRRLLKPGARLIPSRLTLFIRPLIIPEAEARQRAIGAGAIERWRARYGIDFQPLLDAATAGPYYAPTEGEVAARWTPAGKPTLLAALDLTAFEDTTVDAMADVNVEPPRTVNALALTFSADLHGQVTHTLDPWSFPTSSWATSIWVLPDALRVRPHEALRVRYTRRVPGAPDGLTCWLAPREET